MILFLVIRCANVVRNMYCYTALRFVILSHSCTTMTRMLTMLLTKIRKTHTPLLNTVGPILSKGAVTKLEQMPKELFDLRNTESMDGNGYVSKQLHQAFHHYIKV